MSDVKRENEKKKRYLRSYQGALQLEQELEEEIRQLRSKEMAPGGLNQDGMPHGTNNSDLSDYAAKLDALERKLKEQKQKCIDERVEISGRIDAVSNKTESVLLRYRYIQGMSFEQIADKMGYSYRHTTRIHGDALEDFRI